MCILCEYPIWLFETIFAFISKTLINPIMKKIILACIFILSAHFSFAQDSAVMELDPLKTVMIVEASCGQCQFKMAGKGCTLAVRIKGKSYFVDKAHIDAFGDAHGKMGFCNAISKAKVQGEIVNNKFVATYFELIKEHR